MSGATDYQVQKGDAIEAIAEAHGFRSWEAIWNHPNNADLRQQRKSPQILAPGDTLHIPAKEPKEFKCQTNRVHTFVLRVPKRVIQQQFLDDEGEPHVGARYELDVEGQKLSGMTNGKGQLHAELPMEAKAATLKIWLGAENDEPDEYELNFGHLDPVDTIEGAQSRLVNLGYECPASGSLDDPTKAAVKEFQAAMGMTPTGELDPATQAALEDAHDKALDAQ